MWLTFVIIFSEAKEENIFFFFLEKSGTKANKMELKYKMKMGWPTKASVIKWNNRLLEKARAEAPDGIVEIINFVEQNLGFGSLFRT